MNIFSIIRFGALLLLVTSMSVASAGNWFYQTTISTKLEGDDNKRLQSSDEEGVVGIDVRGTIELSKKTENSDMYVRGALRSMRYDGDNDGGLDSDDQYLYAGGRWMKERSEFSVDGEFRRETSLLTELLDTGLFDQVERRVTRSISPQYSYILFENTSVFAGASYTDVEFPNAVPVDLTEYDYKSANTGITHNLSERSSVSVSVFHSKYDADTFQNEVDTTGGNIQYRVIPDELWQLYAGVGYRDSNFKNVVGGVTVRDDDTGSLYDVGAIRQSETLRLEFAFRNELQPSASGGVNDRTEYEFRGNKELTERLTGRWYFLWLENENVNSNDDSDDREYWTAHIGGDYRLFPNWYLTGQYRHRDQEFTGSGDSASADSDAVIFGIRYSGRDTEL